MENNGHGIRKNDAEYLGTRDSRVALFWLVPVFDLGL